MKTYFRSRQCPECGAYHDPTLNACPRCGHQDKEARDYYAFAHQVHDSYIWQILYFVIGFAGLQIFGAIVGIIAQAVFMANHPGASEAEIVQYLSGVEINFTASAVTYALIFGIYFLIFALRKRFKETFHSFTQGKAYLAGVIGAVAILGATIVYNNIVNQIFLAAGMGEIGVNNNETSIRAMVKSFPVWSLLIFGLVGPFCEEMAYRVGIFSFFCRLGKPLGYIASALIFGAIHFNWNAMFTPALQSSLPIEFANLPSYIGSGLALAFLYDRFGLSASYTAHALNNLVSLTLTLAQGN